MTDALKALEDALNAAREEARQVGFKAGFEQGFEKGFAAATAHIRELLDDVNPPSRTGPSRIELFPGTGTERKRRKRGENKDTIINALNRAGKPVGASDLRRIIEMMDDISIPYSSIRHSLMVMKDKGLVTVKDDLWSPVEKEDEPI